MLNDASRVRIPPRVPISESGGACGASNQYEMRPNRRGPAVPGRITDRDRIVLKVLIYLSAGPVARLDVISLFSDPFDVREIGGLEADGLVRAVDCGGFDCLELTPDGTALLQGGGNGEEEENKQEIIR